MIRVLFLILISCTVTAQTLAEKISTSTKTLLANPQAYAASLSLYIADADGKLVYEYDGNRGLSTASTQKIFTAAAALETLGKDYRYVTTASYTGTLKSGLLTGDLVIKSNGDPTLGSWRYTGFTPDDFKIKLLNAVREEGITTINGNIILHDSYFDFQSTPGGWPWNDMGNYYGAGTFGINWRENQFDLMMNGASILGTNVTLPGVKWVNDVKAAGTSDQSIIYTAPYSEVALITGKLPNKKITVSGAMPNPALTLGGEIKNWLSEGGIIFKGNVNTVNLQRIEGKQFETALNSKVILAYESPKLQEIIYWFLRKSVNLYGEALVKTLAKTEGTDGSFDSGVFFLKQFWKSKGINPITINFADGSGLSPQNYASARAEVQALLWAAKQSWFKEFYEGFPVQTNGMKMKSGTVKNTKSFAGYHTSKDGKKYVYAVILNNYQGNAISEALFKILNNLK